MRRILAFIALTGCCLPRASAEEITALTTNNELVFVDHATPATGARKVTLTGLNGETIIGIDYRPATGGLYGLSNANRLYLINPQTGAATTVGAAGAFTLSGTRFGFNFNPTVDRIRVVSDTEQNIRLNPNDGTLAGTDGALAFAAGDPNAAANPNVVACAYTNSFPGAAATVLYDIDSTLNVLTLQSPPNNGALVTVGGLGFDTTENVGFDISGTTGRAYAAYTVAGVVGLYTVDLSLGTSTFLGVIADPVTLGSATVRAIAVASPTRLVNLSSRGRVGVGADVLIGGFVTKGGTTTKVLFRAIGPSLAGFGVAGPLADPTISVYDAAGNLVGSNDDWMSTQSVQITATGFAPTNPAEAAVLLTVGPGAYTAVVSGKAGATGVAVVEAYEIP